MKKIKGVLVTPSDKGNTYVPYVLNFDNHKSLYSILNCQTFTVANRKIGDKRFDIYCDDEGLLKNDFKFAASTEGGDEILAGNLFIVTNDGEGDIKSITDKDVDMILSQIFMATVDGVDSDLLLYSF
jgi:hypothetical protein